MKVRFGKTILLALGVALAAGPARATGIAVLFSSGIEPYAVAYEGFSEVCPANYWKYDLSETDISEESLVRKIVRKGPDLIVALGSKAFEAVEGRTGGIPVVFVMVLEHSERFGPDVAGASIRVDPTLEMEHVRLIFPEWKRIGVIYDPANSAHVIERARRAAGDLGLEIVARTAGDLSETLKAIREIEQEVDGWWMLPDRTTLKAESAEYMIVQSLRRGTPVLAPARRYVEQGANAALVPDYRHVGRNGAAIALRILGGEKPGEIGTVFAEEIRIVINARTGREAGVDLSGSWAKKALVLGR